jgi:hypothetical protein
VAKVHLESTVSIQTDDYHNITVQKPKNIARLLNEQSATSKYRNAHFQANNVQLQVNQDSP